MSLQISPAEAKQFVSDQFSAEGIAVLDITVRQYPEEMFFIVLVAKDDLERAADLGNRLDSILHSQGINGFVTVRVAPQETPTLTLTALKKGVHDERVGELVRLLTARSRTSEIQPSLSYVPDAAANISKVTTPRHHLVFGRRGAGKTSLMVEAKRTVEEAGDFTLWMNIQTYRREEASRVFLWTVQRLSESIRISKSSSEHVPRIAVQAEEIGEEVHHILSRRSVDIEEAYRLIPVVQSMLRRFLDMTARRMYLFFDDFHYLPRGSQPLLLDMLHGCVRDCDAWLKVAGIKHLSRWYQAHPPLGLQTGQDADHIDLDLSLQEPSRAKAFLEAVLQRYATHVKVRSVSNVFSREALDRLVLASGAVPRDYLVLGSGAIERAQQRENAKLVGGQDVNNAAGDAAQVKVRELEEDLASYEGYAEKTLAALQRVRAFCLEETKWTYFRVDFKDKERLVEEYELLTSLMDVRLIHLVNPSVSDERRAGERFEVFTLDLSQFSGQRLKKYIRVLDFVGGHMVSRETGRTKSARVGDSPKALLAILRRGPLFELRNLSFLVDRHPPPLGSVSRNS